MSTIKTTLPVAFTNPGSLPQFIGRLPVVPTRRFSGQGFRADQVGTAPTLWPEAAGGTPATVFAGAPTVVATTGGKALLFNGVADSVSLPPGGTVSDQTLFTVAKYVSLPGAASTYHPALTFGGLAGWGLSRKSSNLMMATWPGALVMTAPNVNVGEWHVFMAQWTATTLIGRVDDTEQAAAGSSFIRPATGTVATYGVALTAGLFSNIQLAEHVQYNRALTLAERNSVVTALRTLYGI